MILNGFGIESASFWRGYDENCVDAVENNWIGADGSKVLAFLMPRAYTTGAGYGPGEKDNLKYPFGFLYRAWEMMIKNAAHDSIGGAHGDAIAHDVEHRYERVGQIGAGVLREAIDALVGTKADEHDVAEQGEIAIFNPQTKPWTGVVELDISIPDTQGRDGLIPLIMNGLCFTDDGRFLNSHIIEDRETARPVYGDRRNPLIKHTRTLRALVEVGNIPPLGLKFIQFDSTRSAKQNTILNADNIDEGDERQPEDASLIVSGVDSLRSKYVEVKVYANGTFDLKDRITGEVWPELNLLIDDQDKGTQYAFDASRNGRSTLCAPGSLEILNNSVLRGTIRVNTRINCFDDRADPSVLRRRAGNDAATVSCQFPPGTGTGIIGPEISDPRLAFTAFKRMESFEDGFIFRFFNRSEETVESTIKLGRIYKKILLCNLDESVVRTLAGSAESVEVSVHSKKIVTLGLIIG